MKGVETPSIDDVLLEYGGLPHVLPLAQVEGTILKDILAL